MSAVSIEAENEFTTDSPQPMTICSAAVQNSTSVGTKGLINVQHTPDFTCSTHGPSPMHLHAPYLKQGHLTLATGRAKGAVMIHHLITACSRTEILVSIVIIN